MSKKHPVNDKRQCQTSRVRALSRQMVRELGLVHSTHPDLEVSNPQLHALLELEEYGDLTVAELSKILGADKSVISRTISSLVKAGWVISRSGEGRRRKPLMLSRKGVEVAHRINSHCGGLTGRALQLINPRVRDELENALSEYVRALKQVRALRCISYRRARAADLAPLNSAYVQIRAEVGVSAFAEDGLQISDLRRRRTACVVAIAADHIVAGACIQTIPSCDATVCYLRGVFVLPEVRRQGIATQIIQRCLAEAKRVGYKQCRAECTTQLEGAISLYSKLGFTKMSTNRKRTRSKCTVLFIKDL